MARERAERTAGSTSPHVPAAPTRGPAGPDRRAPRLVATSWVLLLSALVTPLLTDNPGRLGTEREFFRSGVFFLQAYAAQILVMGSLACFAAALWTRRSGLRWHPALGMVLGLLGWTGLTTALSPSPASALLGLGVNSQGLLLRIVATTALLLTVGLADGTTRIRTAARTLSLVGAAAAVVGLLQVTGLNPLGTVAGNGFGRSFGTLTNPDMFGGFIMFALFTSFGSALSEKSSSWRMAMRVTTLVCAAAAVTSYSRAAWIGVVVGAIAFSLLARKAHLKVDLRLAVAVAAIVLATGIAAAVHPSTPGSGTDLRHRIASVASLDDPDSAVRLEIWAMVVKAVSRRPLLGYGPDTMVLATEPVRSARFARIADPLNVIESAHSTPVQTMSDLGIPGFLLWAVMLVAIATASWRSITDDPEGSAPSRLMLAGLWASCAAYLADSLFTPSTAPGTITLFCVLGLLIAQSATRRVFRTQGARRLLAVTLGIVAVAGAIVGVSFLAADMDAAIARDESLPGPRRVEAGAAAVRLDPFSVDYAAVNSWALLGEARARGEAHGDPAVAKAYFEAALAEARRAARLEPTNQRRRSFLAGVLYEGTAYLGDGLYGQGLAEYAAAVTMSPMDLLTRYEYARALPPARGRPAYESILSLRPGYAAAAEGLARLYVTAGDPAAARRVLRAALDSSPGPDDRSRLERALAVTR